MRALLAAALGVLLAAAPARALDLAEPAPALAVTTWLSGGPVDVAALKGRVVVVAFWATWCAPSVRAIETLSALQKRFADRGVVVAGVSVADPNNDLAKARAFVEHQGDAMGYAVGFEEGEATWKAWMAASGQKSLSTAFVVDPEGRVAWIGDPKRGLEKVVEEILAGRYSAERARRVKDAERRIDEAVTSFDWPRVLREAEALVADHPGRGHAHRFRALARLGRTQEALAAAKAAIETAHDEADVLLALARSLSAHAQEGEEFQDLAIRALSRVIDLEPDSAEIPAMKFDWLLSWGRAKEAQATGAVLVQRLNDSAEELNNFAWGLLTEDSKKGKFNPLALLAASRASELSGHASWYILDTLALARFEMGEVAEAVRLEEKALAIARGEKVPEGQLKALQDALERFRKGK